MLARLQIMLLERPVKVVYPCFIVSRTRVFGTLG